MIFRNRLKNVEELRSKCVTQKGLHLVQPQMPPAFDLRLTARTRCLRQRFAVRAEDIFANFSAFAFTRSYGYVVSRKLDLIKNLFPQSELVRTKSTLVTGEHTHV